MILFTKTYKFAVSTMEEVDGYVEQLLIDNPGAQLDEVKKKQIKTKNVEYIRTEVSLEFLNEGDFKRGEA